MKFFNFGKKKKEEDPFELLVHPNTLLTSMCFEYGPDEMLDFELAKVLKSKLKQHNAVSISANQVGVLKRLMVYAPTADEREIQVCFNPVIVQTGIKTVSDFEGSISVKNITWKFMRYDTIYVNYVNDKGFKIAKKIRGWEARIFQHEIDQLDGTFIPQLVQQKKEIQSAKIS